MTQELSDAQRKALWRCYEILLQLPAKLADAGTQTEDADLLAGNAASSGGTLVVATERAPMVTQPSPESISEGDVDEH